MAAPVGDVFAALGDPTRRFLLQELAARGSATATELAARLPVTRQAVAKHLAVLREAGLVAALRRGREARYELRGERLEEAVAWLTDVGAQWEQRLDALRRHVEARG